MNDILIHAIEWTHLRNTMLRKGNKSQKFTNDIVSFTRMFRISNSIETGSRW